MAVVVPEPESEGGENAMDPSVARLSLSTGVLEAMAQSLNIPSIVGPDIAKSLGIPNLIREYVAGPLSFGLDPNLIQPLNLGMKLIGEDVGSRLGSSLASTFLMPGIGPLTGLNQLWAPIALPLQQRITESLGAITSTLTELGVKIRNFWPDNLDEVLTALNVETMKKLMLDEGLPIAWVPRAATMAAVVAAETPPKRRDVYGRKWVSIAEDCAARESEMDSVAMAPYRRFLAAAIAMLGNRHYEGAQALATSTIETLALEFLSTETKKEWAGRNPLPDPEKLPVQNFFVACQLWGAYRPWWPGDPAPSTYSRHASAHRVTAARQYTRTNATLAVAHLTSMMWAFDTAYGQGGASTIRTKSGDASSR